MPYTRLIPIVLLAVGWVQPAAGQEAVGLDALSPLHHHRVVPGYTAAHDGRFPPIPIPLPPTDTTEPVAKTMSLPPHHDHATPDYLGLGVQAILASVRRPLPPTEAPTLHGSHHESVVPNYAAAVRPPVQPQVRIPAPPPGQPPAVVRGVYLNAWVFGSDRFYDLLRLADTTEINAFVIDVKDATGHVTYRSGVPTAVAVGANAMIRAADVRRRLALLRARGIHPIARIVVAKDPLLARRKPEWGIRHVNGGIWHDRFGDPWVDAYRDSVWIYAAELSAEAVLLGFRELQFDYVRFPDEKEEYLATARFTARRPGESRRSGIHRNLRLLRRHVERLGVPFTLDVFGLTTSATGDMGIGQHWNDLVRVADVLLPMVYPSHYPRGAYGISYPNAEPYAVVRRAIEEGLNRSASMTNAARIRPFLQAFTLRRPRYTGFHVREQIRAVEELGITDWILWNARGVYPADAFRPLAPATSVSAPAPSDSRR